MRGKGSFEATELMVEGKRRGRWRISEVADSRKMLVCFNMAGTWLSVERTELGRKDRVGWSPGHVSRTVEALEDKGPRQACLRPGERMGLRTRRKALILEGKEEKDFGWASALYTESGPAPLRLPLKLGM